MKVKYEQGRSSCHRCGKGIKHNYIVELGDGSKYVYGSECIHTILNLDEKGKYYYDNYMLNIEARYKNIVKLEKKEVKTKQDLKRIELDYQAITSFESRIENLFKDRF
jgi:hypothetical protein